MTSIEIRRHEFRISFLDRICLQLNRNGEFWQEDVRKNLPFLRIVHTFDYPEASCTSILNIDMLSSFSHG